LFPSVFISSRSRRKICGPDIRRDGSSVCTLPSNKRHVNTVFQSYALFPHLSVFENVLTYTYLPFAVLPLYSTIEKFDFSGG
jgi:ABC-type uncharacterized transport system YnjBCD ATPase subunit